MTPLPNSEAGAGPSTSGSRPGSGRFGASGALPDPPLPAVSRPKGGGAIRGVGEKVGINSPTGTGSITVPLAVSPGRAGFGPELSLSYDSAAGNGIFGFGWGLGLPAITRKTDKGLPTYDDAKEADTYILSGAEDLVPVLVAQGTAWVRHAEQRVVNGTAYLIHRYRPRVEGLFARIERWMRQSDGDVSWRSMSKDNVTSLYGADSASRIADPADPRRVFAWLIVESRDGKGNAVVYDYAAEDGQGVDVSQSHERHRERRAARYPKRIRYGNRVSALTRPDLTAAEWLFEVVFDYDEGHYEALDPDPTRPVEDQHRFVRAAATAAGVWSVRPDPFSSCRGGFELRTYRRCRRVLMFHRFEELGAEPCLVRATEFDYADLDYGVPRTASEELAHPGSTRVRSLVRSITHTAFTRDAQQPALVRNGVPHQVYLRKRLPALEFEYSAARIADDVLTLAPGSLENLPVGLDATNYQWIDLDGEGLTGVLVAEDAGWHYKRNLGDGRFGPQETLRLVPSTPARGGGEARFLDLAGDGRLDVAALAGSIAGFYERTADEAWEPFRPFAQLPAIPWDDPNLRFVDVNGDGHADVLISEDNIFTWYPSLGEAGFGPARRVRQAAEEEAGPHLVFADGTESIYLADMSGDGLNDIVRIRSGEVCYWPNLGYGRFGPKVTMDRAPQLDDGRRFDQRRVRLADIDGSGTTDLIYLGRDGVRLYFNHSGNGWTDARALAFPPVDNLASVHVLDLMGNGTACLVWSSPMTVDRQSRIKYVDLMGGVKPHLLVRMTNNLGAETSLAYAASTKFYAADRLAGRPWITRIPFPVHVVERRETDDRVSGSRFITRYAYHHGYFDGIEREFRGFGLVEQWDTEEFSALGGDRAPTNLDAASHVPPVLTRSWFHTGAYLAREHISDSFATLSPTAGGYYRESGATDPQALLLDDTVLLADLTAEEEREACRALKGSLLRREVYALDGTAREADPYSVTEQNFSMRRLQPRADNRHGVFFVHAREELVYEYERNRGDPRTTHNLTLAVDDFGNVLSSASVAYGRRHRDPALDARDAVEQQRSFMTYAENEFTRAVEQPDAYRAPLPCASRSYELTGVELAVGRPRFGFAEVIAAAAAAAALAYEQRPTRGRLEKRLIAHTRILYRRDNLAGPLPFREMQSLGLPYERYQLAITAGLVAQTYGGRVSDAILVDEGRFVHSEGDADWWIPGGQVFLSPDPGDTPARELAHAQAHFFLPHRARNPFHGAPDPTEAFVRYDRYDLLVEETRDALANRLTVGERALDPLQPLVRGGQNYRVLQPEIMMDANRNRMAAAFDTLGMVVATAVMGKPEDAPRQGDLLTGFSADLTDAALLAQSRDPLADQYALLGRASTRVIYDLFGYERTRTLARPQPAAVHTLARETHDAELHDTARPVIKHNFSYSDGSGREIQRKAQAEAGPVPVRDPATGRIVVANGRPVETAADVGPRWVGSGWAVYNNKGKPVRQYEPFFTDLHRFEFDAQIGVSSTLFYDPLERVVATLHPDHAWTKMIFDPWRQETWDVNDTVLAGDPAADPDVGGFFGRLPAAEYLPTWYAARQAGALGADEQDAADKAAVHAGTPTVVHFDPLGRPFCAIAHDRFRTSDAPPAAPPVEEFHTTRVRQDIEGNQLEVFDGLGRLAMRYDYDLTGGVIHQASMDAGERWTLGDVSGKAIRAWDSRGQAFRTTYDPLRRPTTTFLRDGPGAEVVIGRTVYGESQADPEAANLRGQTVQRFDQAGVATAEMYDFKGNPVRSRRQLARHYTSTLDWSGAVPLEAESYTTAMRFDALARPAEWITPDGTVVLPTYNEAGLPEALSARLRGAADSTSFVADIDYDAKGRRTRIAYGNGTTTTYDYDRQTFRLARIRTQRGGDALQDLSYTHDPIGNITRIRDAAQPVVFFRNRVVGAGSDYTYDAIYRLIEATGREHLGQAGGRAGPPTPPSALDVFHTRLDQPGDGRAMGTYLERYTYDAAGNLATLVHLGTQPVHPGWTQTYTYGERSLLDPTAMGNRLSAATIGGNAEDLRYDGPAGAHGDITAMPHLAVMRWDHGDRLRATARQRVNRGTPETTWYVYDANGDRTRTVTERAAGEGATPSRAAERIYLGPFEIYREYGAVAEDVTLERETLHVMDGEQRIALVETDLTGPGARNGPAVLVRYQLGNHLGSAVLELDAQARIISYEEYTPYGSSAYQAVRSQVEASKRYRFTAKERDAGTGFDYFGARYYAPWLGRWLSPDPAGPVDGYNLYQFTQGNPVRLMDRDGQISAADLPDPDEFRRQAEVQLKSLHRLQADLNETVPEVVRAWELLSPLDRINNAQQVQSLLDLQQQLPQLISDLGKAKNMFGDSSVGGRALTQIHLATKDLLSSVLNFQLLVASLIIDPIPTVAGILAHEGARAAGVEDPLLLGLISLGATLGAATALFALPRAAAGSSLLVQGETELAAASLRTSGGTIEGSWLKWQFTKIRYAKLRLGRLSSGADVPVPSGQASVRLLSDITEATGKEVALLRLESGGRVLRLGEAGKVGVLDPGRAAVRRAIAHTHPSGKLILSGSRDLGGVAGDLEVLRKLGARSHVIVDPLGRRAARLTVPQSDAAEEMVKALRQPRITQF